MAERSWQEVVADLHRVFATPLDDDVVERHVNALLASDGGAFLGLVPVWRPPR